MEASGKLEVEEGKREEGKVIEDSEMNCFKINFHFRCRNSNGIKA